FRPTSVVIEHMHVKTPLHSHQGRQQADGTGASDKQYFRAPPPRALADALGVVPRLGQNAGGLQKDAKNPQCGVDLDRELRFDAEVFGPVAVALLDTPLSVTPVAAHVPFAGSARDRAGVRFRQRGPPGRGHTGWGPPRPRLTIRGRE